MSEKNIDLLRRDEAQPLTSEQIEEIKARTTIRPKANINIVPYHIYSPEEHIVGEWREEIDGVFKKKPVYEKRMYLSSANSSTSGTITETDGGLISDYLDNDRSFIIYSRAQDSSSASTILQLESSFDPSTKRYVKVLIKDKHFVVGNSAGRAVNNIYGIVHYIKTSDEWEII